MIEVHRPECDIPAVSHAELMRMVLSAASEGLRVAAGFALGASEFAAPEGA